MKSPTCTILYEQILATIRKSGLYDFIRMAYSQPQMTSKKLCRQHGPIWPKLERHGVSLATCRDMLATFPAKGKGACKSDDITATLVREARTTSGKQQGKCEQELPKKPRSAMKKDLTAFLAKARDLLAQQQQATQSKW